MIAHSALLPKQPNPYIESGHEYLYAHMYCTYFNNQEGKYKVYLFCSKTNNIDLDESNNTIY